VVGIAGNYGDPTVRDGVLEKIEKKKKHKNLGFKLKTMGGISNYKEGYFRALG
jgi:hypothetical protein